MMNSATLKRALNLSSILLLFSCTLVRAQDSGIHKCVAADGKVTYQQYDCPTGATGKTVSYGPAVASTLTLAPNINHQYSTTLAINGISVEAYVDTGATYVTISSNLAEKMRISYDNASGRYMQTANGIVAGARKTVSVLKVGNFELYNVEIIIMPNSPTLIGMSALSQLKFANENGNLVLSKR